MGEWVLTVVSGEAIVGILIFWIVCFILISAFVRISESRKERERTESSVLNRKPDEQKIDTIESRYICKNSVCGGKLEGFEKFCGDCGAETSFSEIVSNENFPITKQTPEQQLPSPSTPLEQAPVQKISTSTPVMPELLRRCINDRCSYQTEKNTAVRRINRGMGCPACDKPFEIMVNCISDRCSYETEITSAQSLNKEGLGCPSCGKSFKGIAPLPPVFTSAPTPAPVQRPAVIPMVNCISVRCSYKTEKSTAISRAERGLGCPACDKGFQEIPLTSTSSPSLRPATRPAARPPARAAPRPITRPAPEPVTQNIPTGSSNSTDVTHVEIVDYKTGKHDPRFIGEPMFQIKIYAAAVEQFMGYKVKKVKLVYMRPDQHHIEARTIRRTDINETKQKFNRVWRDIKSNAQDGRFPCKTGPLCNWCDAQNYCPAWEGATNAQRSRRYGPFGTHPNANPSLGRCSDRLPSALSPSSAIEYLQCPRKFYESKISGRIVFQATEATTKGNLAHHAFEKIFNVPVSQRTPEKAVSFIRPYWEEIRHTEEQEDVNNLSASEITTMLRETEDVVKNWFTMENPKEMNPIDTELKVEGMLGNTPMRGIIDRIDISEL